MDLFLYMEYKMGKIVLNIDFDPQGNVTQSLGYAPDALDVTVSSVVGKDDSEESDY